MEAHVYWLIMHLNANALVHTVEQSAKSVNKIL